MRACANFNTNKENGKWLRATLLQYLRHFFSMFWLRVCRFLTWTLNENIMYIKLGPKSNFAVIIKQRHYFFFLSFCKHASRVSVQGCGMYLKLLRRQILLAKQKILSPCRIYNDNLKKKIPIHCEPHNKKITLHVNSIESSHKLLFWRKKTNPKLHVFELILKNFLFFSHKVLLFQKVLVNQ